MCALAVAALSGVAGAQQGTLTSGIDLTAMDKSVRPQDDFYRFVNGTWLAKTEIPAEKASYGSFDILADKAEQDVRAIIEDAAKSTNRAPGSVAQQVGDLYASFMNDARVDQLGVSPLKPELDRIDAGRACSLHGPSFQHGHGGCSRGRRRCRREGPIQADSVPWPGRARDARSRLLPPRRREAG
jgi:hypothetical protein